MDQHTSSSPRGRRGLVRALLALAIAGTAIGLGRPAAAQSAPAICSSTMSKVDDTSGVANACTTGKGQAAIDLRYANLSFSDATGTGIATYPQAGVRVGVSDVLELDAYAGSYERRRSSAVAAHGYGDAAFGARYRVLGSGRAVVTAVADASVPTGDPGYSAGKTQYSIGLASRYALGTALAVETSLTYGSRYSDPTGTNPQWYASYAPAVALVTSPVDGTSFYVEGSGATKAAPGLGPEYQLGAGVRRQLGSGTVVALGLTDGLSLVNGTRSHELRFALTKLIK